MWPVEGLLAKKIKIAFLILVKRVEAPDQELFPLDVVAIWEPVSMATNYYKAILFPSNYCNLLISCFRGHVEMNTEMESL